MLVVSTSCVSTDEVEPETSSVESASTVGQGTRYQGTRYQGTRYQGTRYQGATLGAVSASNATVDGTALVVWTPKGKNWQQRFPNKICTWNSTRTKLNSCSTINLATAPSPLAGLTFPASFLDEAGNAMTGSVKIGATSTTIGAVKADTSLAMHKLDGASTATFVAYQAKSPPSTESPLGEICDNPNGCRVNSDLWTYDVRLADVFDANGAPLTFCENGEASLALAGTWSATGGYTADSTSFTFSCTTGTIAKCARWGYRPFGSARKSDGVTTALADYHQACIRGATADYCANGNSFTRDGTLVDVYDYKLPNGSGFVPRTRNSVLLDFDATAFVWESTFDKYGAKFIDHARYEEAATINNTTTGCPGRFYLSTDDALATYNRCTSVGQNSACTSSAAEWSIPAVSIDSTPACAHSEQMVGKWLHESCSSCTNAVKYSEWTWTAGYTYAHCTDPQGGGWDSSCVAKAQQVCSPASQTASHNECTVGAGLDKFDTGCTLQVCLENESCCTANGWTSDCVAAANTKCTGGQEGFVLVWILNRWQARPVGFCGT
ncbi:MAG: hypothetical protein H0V17_01750 [Deltaproteobacteria bacterium]|nr:hypothetical protein [Deltaproteobacteria bacterium]